jgi:hypothetical protein
MSALPGPIEVSTFAGCFGDCRSVFLEHYFVDVAPHPIFAWLDGTDDGMFDGVKVLRGMLVLGTVAASDVTAGQTQTQMDPFVPHLEAFLTALGFRLYVADLIGVGANLSHWASPPAQSAG